MLGGLNVNCGYVISESYSTATQLRPLVAMSTELAETHHLQH